MNRSAGTPRPRSWKDTKLTTYPSRGLGLLVDQFMRALPHYYSMELHNFNPNSIA